MEILLSIHSRSGMQKQIIICDLDGTLLNHNKNISSITRDTMRSFSQRGYVFGIATGRSIDTVIKLSHDWGIYDSIEFIIGMNGAQLYEKQTNQVQSLHRMKKEQINAIVAYTYTTNNNIYIYHLDNQTAYVRKYDTYSTYIQNINHTSHIETLKLPIIIPADKLLILGEEDELIQFEKELVKHPEWKCKSYKTLPFCLEIVHQLASKADAVEFYCKKKGFSLDSTVAFGDQMNDIELLSLVGYGVAMKNACAEAKAVAKDITTYTNNQSGVAKYLISKEKDGYLDM